MQSQRSRLILIKLPVHLEQLLVHSIHIPDLPIYVIALDDPPEFVVDAFS